MLSIPPVNIMRLSREYAIPILYVSHIMEEILNLADHLVIMDRGRLIAAGALEDLLSKPELQARLGQADDGAMISTGLGKSKISSAG